MKGSISFLTATALVVANMIGTGVFTSLGFQTGMLPSVTVLMILWACGGLLALCGGLCYVELSRLYPGSGGEYHYIKSAYGSWPGNAARITSILAGFAAPVALSALAFSSYLAQVLPWINVKGSAVLILTLVTGFHCFSLRTASRFQLLTTGAKALLIISFIVAGLISSENHLKADVKSDELKLLFSPGFASSIVYVSFAYSGWNASTYIYNEMKHPLRNIRASILAGTVLVTTVYLLLNFVFLKVLPLAEITDVIEVGGFAATRIFGDSGGKLVAAMISILLISSMSAMIWLGPRVIDPNAPNLPLAAIGLQYVVTVCLLLSGTFLQLLANAALLLNICSCAAVIILVINYRKVRISILIVSAIFISANLWSMIYLVLDIVSS